jgi:Flp pilus assembly protein TadD
MNTIRMAVLAISVALAGCQTTGVDNTKTTSISPKAKTETETVLGKEQFLDANYGLAEKHFRKAVETKADDAEAWMGLAASYDELGRFDFADRAYEALLKVAGRKPQIVSNLGYSKLLRGDKKEAKKLFNEAAAAMPGNARIQANLKLVSSL